LEKVAKKLPIWGLISTECFFDTGNVPFKMILFYKIAVVRTLRPFTQLKITIL
jgi:hypothetical protein